MSSPSQTAAPPSNFKSMLDVALAEYKEKTGDDLLAHWLAAELQTCESVDAVLNILRDQAKTFERSGDQKLMKWIDPLVHVLYTFSGALGDGVSLAFPPAKVIFTGIGVLLAAAKDARASHGAIVDLFERIESFFKRLGVYTQISLTTEMAEVLVKIVIELLSILSIATKEVKRRRTKIYFRKLLGRTDIEDALRRLDSLIQEEVQMATAQTLKVTTEVKDGTDKINMAMQQMSNDMQEVKWTQMEQEIHEWFSPPDPSTNYNIACDAHYEGTAAWFFEGTTFKDWMSIGSLLWIHGKPGSGKSVLCSMIIKHVIPLRDAGQASLAYFYFDFRDKDKKQDLRNFVASLIIQLSANSSPCCKIISRIHSAHGKGTQQPSNGVLTDCLREMLSVAAQQPIYIIVDALDECPDTSGMPTPREAVLDLLEDLVRLCISNLHICITSRPEIDIKKVLEPLPHSAVSLHDESGQMKDISDYVTSVVHVDRKMRSWRDEERKLVVEELSNKADGMFRWVFCQLEVLRHCLPASIRQTLDQLPKSLDETYLRVLSQIPQANQAHAHRMLQCLTVAFRPLRVEELAELLAFEFDAAQGGIPKYRPAWRLDDQTQAVLSTCSSLVTIINDRIYDHQVVQFSHFSVKEFLMSDRLTSPLGDFSEYQILPGPAHTILTRACLGFLLHSDDHIDEKSFPLAEYAARHWVKHAQFEDVASHVKDGMETLFDSNKRHFAAWIATYYDTYVPDNVSEVDYSKTQISPDCLPGPDLDTCSLCYSALCGFYDLVKHLAVKHPRQVNTICGQYRSPLLAALSGDHIEVAELLLEHGANVDVRGPTGETILLKVLSWHQDSSHIVEFLLKHGADVNARDNTPRSSLHIAEYDGKLKVAQMLVQHKADVNSQDNNGKTPLHILSDRWTTDKEGSLNHMQFLLKHGAEVDRRDKDNQTPLLLATQKAELKRMRILLENGADANAENNDGETPLHILSEYWVFEEDDVLDHARLLLEHGAEVNRRDKENQAPLLLAMVRGRFKLAQILLEHGASANVKSKDGKTPLHLLAEDRGHNKNNVLESNILNLAVLLLEHGAELNRRDGNNQTPLLLAMGRDWFKLAQILLEHGADANGENSNGQTPLHLLSGSQNHNEGDALDLVWLLLEHGAEVNGRDKNNLTPLLLAIGRDWFKLTQILLEHGADANAENYGETPLYILSERLYHICDFRDHLEYEKLQLEHGAEVNRRYWANETPLPLELDASVEDKTDETSVHQVSRGQYGSRGRGVGVSQLLLERGMDIDLNGQDENRMTPSHLQCDFGPVQIAQALLDHGANVDARHNGGELEGIPVQNMNHPTPLHWASYHGRLDIARVLLDHGATANSEADCWGTPLHLASCRGRFAIARMLLDRGAAANSKDYQGRTPLHSVTEGISGFEQDRIGIVQLLLERGADVNAKDKNNATPLHLASYNERFAIARVLLDRGAAADSKDNQGQTPLHSVADSEYWEAYRYSEEDRSRVAQLLLERGAGVDTPDESNRTPLHLASYNGNIKIARLLLNAGATANSKCNQGRTPLHVVAKGGCHYFRLNDIFLVAQLLLEHGANVNVWDNDNQTPLHFASDIGKAKMVLVLLNAGANGGAKNAEGQTPLHLVSQGPRDNHFYPQDDSDRVVVAQLLLEHGADANIPDNNNQTPLHLASYVGRDKLVLVLLNAGANGAAKNAEGQTPLHFVSQRPLAHYYDLCQYLQDESDRIVIAQLLLERGADVNAQDKNHATPTDLASAHRMTEVVSLLRHYGDKANAKIDQRPTLRQPGLDVQHHDDSER